VDIRVNRIKVGEYRTNCYLVTNKDKETLIIDPGAEPQKIIEQLEKEHNLNVKYILLTHAHFDHVLAVDEIKLKYPKADVIVGEEDIPLLHQVSLQGVFVGQVFYNPKSQVIAVSEGSLLPYGDDVIKVFSTPGHSKGGVCFQIGNLLFTGDTLFYHTYGRVDLPEASIKDMRGSLDKLLNMEENLVVYPGHGIETTIGQEKDYYDHNPYWVD
jgi:glyoxylase-like metal-dependent hydrolase (beta-lactamase superfamily II)